MNNNNPIVAAEKAYVRMIEGRSMPHAIEAFLGAVSLEGIETAMMSELNRPILRRELRKSAQAIIAHLKDLARDRI